MAQRGRSTANNERWLTRVASVSAAQRVRSSSFVGDRKPTADASHPETGVRRARRRKTFTTHAPPAPTRRAPASLLSGTAQSASVGAVALFTGVAALARRRLLAVELALAGVLAWGLAKWIRVLFERPLPGVLFDDAYLHGDVVTGLGYLSSHAAIAATLATVAGPWLPRRLRRVAWGLALLVGASRIYVGAHLPLDVLGGYALGWAIGAVVHLALGAPGGRPTAGVTGRALRSMGVEVEGLEPAQDGSRPPRRPVACTCTSSGRTSGTPTSSTAAGAGSCRAGSVRRRPSPRRGSGSTTRPPPPSWPGHRGLGCRRSWRCGPSAQAWGCS